MLQLLTNDGSGTYLDLSNEDMCNWLCLVKPASYPGEQNCMAYQLNNQIYYSTTREVTIGERLKVWYAKGFARKLNKPLLPGNNHPSQQCPDEMAEIVGQNVAAFEEAQHGADTNRKAQSIENNDHSRLTTGDIVEQALDECRNARHETANDIIEQSIVGSHAFDITRDG